MKADLTDVTLLIDRSSSMRRIQRSAEQGVNDFIARQAAEPGDARLTLVQFDSGYEFLHRGEPFKTIPRFRLYLGRGTALLDAMGRAINETHARLAALDECERPGLIAFVVVSDGEENASREFTRKEIRRTIQRQQSEFRWHFTFLGANQNVEVTSSAMGFSPTSSASWSVSRVGEAYLVAAEKLARMRRQAANNEPIDNSFTSDDRSRMI